LETHVHLLSDDLPPNISILDGLPDPADHKATIPAVRSGEMEWRRRDLIPDDSRR
jgi:hypothetical protein